MLDNFVISLAQVSNLILPILGAACLIALFVALIKLAKLFGNLTDITEKLKNPANTVDKISKLADGVIDKAEETEKKILNNFNKGLDVVSAKLDTIKKNSLKDLETANAEKTAKEAEASV